MRSARNLREIADALNLSTATVSRVINKKPDVREDTRRKVEDYLQQNSYEPRSQTQKSELIGFVNKNDTYTLRLHYVSNLLEGVNQRVRANGYHCVIIDSDTIDKAMHWPGRYPIFQQLSGLVWSMPIFNEDYLRFLEELSLPCVVINNLEDGVQVPFVGCDNRTAGRQATEYLLGLGHTDIGFLGGRFDIHDVTDRYEGFCEALNSAGVPIQPDLIVDDIASLDEAGGADGMHRLIGRKHLPTALVVVNDDSAIGVYRVASEREVRIPEDVSVVSFDDAPHARLLTPSLTTYRQPLIEMGKSAADMLTSLVSNGKVNYEEAPSRRIKLTIIARQSVRQVDN